MNFLCCLGIFVSPKGVLMEAGSVETYNIYPCFWDQYNEYLLIFVVVVVVVES